MSIAFENVPRSRLTAAIESGPVHYRTIMRMVRDHGVSLAIVAQGGGSFNPPRANPHILIVGDDMQQAKGPSAFHAGSLRRYIKRCRMAVIVSCEPVARAYALAALYTAGKRKDSILVETRPEFEADWKDFIEAANREISFVIATVEGQGGVH